MKSNFTLTFLVLFFTVDSISQTKSEVIFVDGVCGMCEKRIESNCLATKGIKLADWNKENRMLKVIFNEKKISLEQIHKKIASIGHDTKLETAPDEAYNNLFMCCKYRDEEVVTIWFYQNRQLNFLLEKQLVSLIFSLKIKNYFTVQEK